MMPIYKHGCEGTCVALGSRNRDETECSALSKHKAISHLQRKILFCFILPLPRAPLEKKSASHGNVMAMVLFEQKK